MKKPKRMTNGVTIYERTKYGSYVNISEYGVTQQKNALSYKQLVNCGYTEPNQMKPECYRCGYNPDYKGRGRYKCHTNQCPFYTPPTRRIKDRVVIEVRGGVAYVAQAPPEIEVHIVDYDNEGG